MWEERIFERFECTKESATQRTNGSLKVRISGLMNVRRDEERNEEKEKESERERTYGVTGNTFEPLNLEPKERRRRK